MVGLIIGGIFFWGRCVILKVVLMLLNRCFYFWILKVIGLRMIGCLLLNNWKRKRFFWSVWLMGWWKCIIIGMKLILISIIFVRLVIYWCICYMWRKFDILIEIRLRVYWKLEWIIFFVWRSILGCWSIICRMFWNCRGKFWKLKNLVINYWFGWLNVIISLKWSLGSF